MWRRIVESFFFSNYFLGFLAIALSLETSLQLSLPFNSPAWYGILFVAVVLYYTYAYTSAPTDFPNPRTEWYALHRHTVIRSQRLLALAFVILSALFLAAGYPRFRFLPAAAWIFLLLTPLAAIAYYGKIPWLNLRRTAWTKPLTIGYCWAVAVSVLPLAALTLEKGPLEIPWLLAGWLFLKNWMFCSVNAVLFDIKDYEDDSNKSLKTFVVRYGIPFTISFILVPMIILGIISFLLLAWYRDFGMLRILLNLVPFLLTLAIAANMKKQRSILYYLILIDGMLLVKALCGITAALLS